MSAVGELGGRARRPSSLDGPLERGLHRALDERSMSGLRAKSAGRRDVVVHHQPVRPASTLAMHSWLGRHDDVGTDEQVGAAVLDARRVHLVGVVVDDAHVARDRAVLLREAGDVEHRRSLALEVCGHPEQRAHRHDPGAADAGDEHAVGLVRRPRAWVAGSVAPRQLVATRVGSGAAARSFAPFTVTKLGQYPSRHE